jgi:hypothetical protein
MSSATAIPISSGTPVRDAEQRYWWLIRPASGAIRRSWLAAIKRRAERPADGQGESE